METTISTLSILPENKKEINLFKEKVINELSMINNPLELELRLKCLESLIDLIRKDTNYKELILDNLEKEGGKVEIKGSILEKIEAGIKYDYSNCNDTVWNELSSKISVLNEKRKEREIFLKSLPEQVANTDTGEIMYPPIKKSTTSIKIILK